MRNLILAASAALLLTTTTAFARDQISIVGSSTVFPFATTVAEKFGQASQWKTPVIESTGSGGGMKMFCRGVGTGTPDITNSSRAIKKSEEELCAKNGVTPIERLIGYDGIVFSNSKNGEQFSLTKKDIFLAVADQVPTSTVNGKPTVWGPNPNKTWKDVNPALPNIKIDIMIPPTTSGTRDAFVELVMHSVCKKAYDMSKKEYKAQCTAVRTDGPVVQVGENDNLIIEKLADEPKRFGVFGFSFLDQNSDKVQGAFIDGVLPSFESIADSSYGISRPLFYYLKKEHIGIIPGIEEYDAKFTQMRKPGGVLEEQGLIPLAD